MSTVIFWVGGSSCGLKPPSELSFPCLYLFFKCLCNHRPPDLISDNQQTFIHFRDNLIRRPREFQLTFCGEMQPPQPRGAESPPALKRRRLLGSERPGVHWDIKQPAIRTAPGGEEAKHTQTHSIMQSDLFQRFYSGTVCTSKFP